jgi:hypothetical protein
MMAVDDEGRGKGVFVRFNMMVSVGRLSSVGIATCYRLNCPEIGTARLQTGRGFDTDPYTVGTGLFQGIKRQRCGVKQSFHIAVVEERVELYLYSLHGLFYGENDLLPYNIR